MPPSTDSSQNICCVKNISYRSQYPVYGGEKPLLIALGLDSTILDLRKEVETVTGTSVEHYLIGTPNSLGGLANGARVFVQDTGCHNDRFPTFLIRMSLFVFFQGGRNFRIDCTPADSVDSLMCKLDISGEGQYIIFQNKQLQRGKSNFQRLIMFEISDYF